jgi:hypothetical protein
MREKTSPKTSPTALLVTLIILYSLGGLAEAGGNRTHRSGGQPGAGRL